jgi:energy-coupling factor transport system substrate-specific component
VVALVAALAALAIAGRIAFAAFPNVKPTTDIVIFAGFALGPAPGFVVGALTALVSNFWFGQGPWTPWQMAGWGLCGVMGAALAVARPRAGRVTLAAACALAGIAYGALLNFSLMATYGGDLSLQRFLVLESRAVPFDAAHAIGNATLALIAGPAMVRMLSRFRERFEWRTPAVASLLLLALALASVLPARAQASDAGRAAAWLVAAQNSDGGWGTSAESYSSTATTAWVMLGLEAAGRNPLDISRGGHTPVDYLRARINELGSPGDFARTILALEGAGVNPR